MPEPDVIAPVEGDASPLVDAQGRLITYLRLSVTDRCNFRCTYCSPAHWAGSSDYCTDDELVRLVGVFASMGVRRVRLTGGEPLLRPGVVSLAERLKRIEGIAELCLTTNGHHLAKLASPLARWVDRLNVSLDTADAGAFREITGRGRLEPVLEGLRAARDAPFRSRAVNVVVMQGVNDDPATLAELVRMAWAHDAVPRFIELMPFAGGGRHVPTREVVARLQQAGVVQAPAVPGQGAGPSKYAAARAPFGSGEVGFIGAMTDNFCDRCNRVRVTARGELRACLGGRDQVPLIGLLRGGASDLELSQAVRRALGAKWDRHRFEEGGARLLPMMAVGG